LLIHKNLEGDKIFNVYKSLDNQVSYKLDLEESTEGVLIQLPNFPLFGNLEFEIHYPAHLGYPLVLPAPDRGDITLYYNNVVHIDNISFIYTIKRVKYNEIKNVDTTDILFENIINEEYINEFEDIELWINTYNNTQKSYSYVITRNGNSYAYLNEIYNKNTNELGLQEKHILSKLFNYYKNMKFNYINKLKSNNINVCTRFYENTLSKYFILNSFEYDVANDAITVNLSEI
jgi:hypothetical protein